MSQIKVNPEKKWKVPPPNFKERRLHLNLESKFVWIDNRREIPNAYWSLTDCLNNSRIIEQ